MWNHKLYCKRNHTAAEKLWNSVPYQQLKAKVERSTGSSDQSICNELRCIWCLRIDDLAKGCSILHLAHSQTLIRGHCHYSSDQQVACTNNLIKHRILSTFSTSTNTSTAEHERMQITYNQLGGKNRVLKAKRIIKEQVSHRFPEPLRACLPQRCRLCQQRPAGPLPLWTAGRICLLHLHALHHAVGCFSLSIL